MTNKTQSRLTVSDLKGMPPEVLSQLKINNSLKMEWRIIELIRKAGGTASIDKIIVENYKQYKEVFDRINLNAKLYRMKTKGLLETVKSKKGVYKLPSEVNTTAKQDTSLLKKPSSLKTEAVPTNTYTCIRSDIDEINIGDTGSVTGFDEVFNTAFKLNKSDTEYLVSVDGTRLIISKGLLGEAEFKLNEY